jgi:trehalose 6-phosphate phosphatase
VTPPIPTNPALFLDVDGTLLPITARPADARPDPSLLEQLERLHAALGGAVALLTGRRLGAVAEMFAPLVLAAAGTHGLERRSHSGDTVVASIDAAGLTDVRAALVELAAGEPRLLLEDKGDAFAVHYRAAPELAPVLARELQNIARRLGPGFHVQPGLFVFELKPEQPNKGSALLAFMAEAPFRGRTPVAIGDDLTDLHAFRAAESRGGIGIAVGDRLRTQWHLADPEALRLWLDAVLERASGQSRPA